MATTGLWERWTAFAEAAAGAAAAQFGPDNARTVAEALGASAAIDRDGGERALRAFFTEVPAHVGAVDNLDHTQFVNPLCLSPACRVSLCDLLAPFKQASVAAYGEVWLRLLDVAEAAGGPGAFGNLESARAYIRLRQQEAAGGAPAAGAAGAAGDAFLPSPAQLDGVLQAVLGAFPGLRECVSQIAAAAEVSAGSPEGALDGVVDQVQRVLTGPLVQTLQAQTGASTDRLQPCIAQILEGLRGLNSALMAGVAPSAVGDASMQ